jgi:hypothetical protein
MISNFNQAHEKSYGIGITYDFSKLGLTGVRAFGAYAYGSMPAGRWEEEVNATVDYRIMTGALKNCWLRQRFQCSGAYPGFSRDLRLCDHFLGRPGEAPGRARLRPSREGRANPGSDGASPYRPSPLNRVSEEQSGRFDTAVPH